MDSRRGCDGMAFALDHEVESTGLRLWRRLVKDSFPAMESGLKIE